MSESDTSDLGGILQAIARCGDLAGWWPGQGDEVAIGAVLTQQTRWENVQLALVHLKQRGLCNLERIYHTPSGEIEEAIRPAGFYRVKTRRLKALSSFVIDRYGTFEAMLEYPLPSLRQSLLEVPGIGPETADSILCFGLMKPTLVVDRYTEQICACGGAEEKGERLKKRLELYLPPEVSVFQRVHAQFVEYAKEYCGKRKCEDCGIPPLNA
jgi:endonuclease-3 related protein